MANKSHVYERLEDQSQTFDRVDHSEIASALSAEATSVRSGQTGSPFSLGAIRSKLLSELVSTGGRRGRKEAFSRKKIPMTEREWKILDEITSLIKSRGVNTTPGQVAGVLLHQSMTEVLLRLDRVSPSQETGTMPPSELTDGELEETVETILAAAASAEMYLEQLRPVAKELLRRMRAGKGAESDAEP